MNIYELSAGDLKGLNSDRAVDFFRKLLWEEASRVGIGRRLIDAPSCINVGDGGLDAVIVDAIPSSDDVIPTGFSGFQIKSSDLEPAGCKKELHQKNKLIKPGIKKLLDNDGTYVLVLFADITKPQKDKREQAIKDELKNLGYTNAKVRIYAIDNLISFALRFIPLIAWIKLS